MLTELKPSNFRIFDDEVTVRFRPITVLIGRNSSGKSTIVKFLLMLQQSAESGRSQFLTPEGGRVSLGAFRALKNSLTRKRNLKFELKAKDYSESVYYPMFRYLGKLENVDLGELVYEAKATLAYGEGNATGKATYVLVDGISGTNYISIADTILADSTFLKASLDESALSAIDTTELPHFMTNPEERSSFIEAITRSVAQGQLRDNIRCHRPGRKPKESSSHLPLLPD